MIMRKETTYEKMKRVTDLIELANSPVKDNRYKSKNGNKKHARAEIRLAILSNRVVDESLRERVAGSPEQSISELEEMIARIEITSQLQQDDMPRLYNRAELYMLLGNLHYKAGKNHEAVSCYSGALKDFDGIFSFQGLNLRLTELSLNVLECYKMLAEITLDDKDKARCMQYTDAGIEKATTLLANLNRSTDGEIRDNVNESIGLLYMANAYLKNDSSSDELFKIAKEKISLIKNESLKNVNLAALYKAWAVHLAKIEHGFGEHDVDPLSHCISRAIKLEEGLKEIEITQRLRLMPHYSWLLKGLRIDDEMFEYAQRIRYGFLGYDTEKERFYRTTDYVPPKDPIEEKPIAA